MEIGIGTEEYIASAKRTELKKAQAAKAYRDFWHKFIVISFCAVIFGLPALRIILPTPAVSMAENRVLKSMPSADINNIFFGTFTKDFEDYFADTFPLRDPLMEAGEYVSYLYKIPVSGVDSVVVLDNNIMQDGETGAEQEVDPEMQAQEPQPSAEITAHPDQDKPNTHMGGEPQQTLKEQKGTYLLTDTAIYKEIVLNPEEYSRWVQGVNGLAKALPGKRIIVMSPPDSFPFYADPKYFKPENDEKSGIKDMYSMLDPGIYTVDTFPYLNEHKGEYIFFRTDHHWTAYGAYWAYTAFCDTAGIKPEPLSGMQKVLYRDDFLGSYYMQLKNTAKVRLIQQNPDYVYYYIPKAVCQLTMYEKTPLKDGIDIPMFDLDLPPEDPNYYHIFLGGDYPGIKITTDTLNGKSIALLKDSYANTITPYLTAHYQYIYLIDFRDYNAKGKPKFKFDQFVKDNNIDDVLLVLSFEFANDPKYADWYLKALKSKQYTDAQG